MGISQIATIANNEKESAQTALLLIRDWCNTNNVRAITVPENLCKELLSGNINNDDPVLVELKRSDFCISLGGDGTLMRSAQALAKLRIPIFAVNIGNLGFHAQADLENLNDALTRIKNEQYHLKTHIMLEASLEGKGISHLAMNDIVIAKETMGHMIHVDLSIDKQFVTKVSADALIISTPIGSTAYNYAAGGPIITNGVQCVSIVAVCPHRPDVSPFIISPLSNISVASSRHEANAKIFVLIDGQNFCELSDDIVLNITCPSMYLKLIEFDYDYYERLRNKLSWGRIE